MFPQRWAPNTVFLLLCGRVYQIYVISGGSCNAPHQTRGILLLDGWFLLNLFLFCFGILGGGGAGDLARAKHMFYHRATSPAPGNFKSSIWLPCRPPCIGGKKKYLQSFCGLRIWSSCKPKGGVEVGNRERVWLRLLWLTTSELSLGPAFPMLSRFQVCWSISVTGPKCTNFCLGLDAFL